MAEQVGWVATAAGAVFTGLHLPEGQPRSTGVLLAPPFGWEGISSWRNLRGWARQLSRDGYPALRYQPPGEGDSEGAPQEQDLSTWSRALGDLVTVLRDSTGCARVTVIGLGLSGLAALQAVAQGAEVDDLVLWATPARGRSLLREVRAFASLAGDPGQPSSEVPQPAEAITGDDGALWVHGYPLGARAQEQLLAFDVAGLALGRLQRALVLGRGNLPVDARLVQALTDAGVETTGDAGPGYAELTSEPRLSEEPREVRQRVAAWLRTDPGSASGGRLPVVAFGETRVTEGDIDAVITPSEGARLTAVFISAGAIPRSGPNRLWTETARRWADQGIASLRLDMPDVGEARGPDSLGYGPEAFYQRRNGDQLEAVLRRTAQWGLPQSFLLVGLCSGGYWAADVARRDERVKGIVVLNSGSLIWPPPLFARSSRAYLASGATWRRLLRDKSLRVELGRRAGATLASPVHALKQDQPTSTADLLLWLARSGRLVVYGVSPGEPVLEELAALPAVSEVQLTRFAGPGSAHTLAPRVLREQAAALLDAAAWQAVDVREPHA